MHRKSISKQHEMLFVFLNINARLYGDRKGRSKEVHQTTLTSPPNSFTYLHPSPRFLYCLPHAVAFMNIENDKCNRIHTITHSYVLPSRSRPMCGGSHLLEAPTIANWNRTVLEYYLSSIYHFNYSCTNILTVEKRLIDILYHNYNRK